MNQNLEIRRFLLQALEANTEEKSILWLKQKAQKIQESASPTAFFLSFSQASRYFTKDLLKLSEQEKNQADQLVSGFEPAFWNVLQSARSFLLLNLPEEKETWFSVMNQLFETGDMHEQQALFAALPILPFKEDLLSRAIDGCRTNMTLIFDAIALNNPFPAAFFPEANWNQLVLKAVFMQRPLYRIQGLEKRRNSALAEIASDFAHERWAAGRNVMPELWRLVVPFVHDQYLPDLKKVMSSADKLEQSGGALTLYECDFAPAKALLADYPKILASLESGEVTWEKIGKEYQDSRV
ncbi:EboA domain-containing protein [Algoriphagus sp.]|uniref:EboA domain-containing protein n=1 Tax=Algoriphagus sp. TaxID=1872435 RepID=UPI002624D786|nr:EboA domain-containing protein [Algoriphagus sp.]